MKNIIGALVCIALLLCACNREKNTDSLQRSEPEKQGVSSKDILAFLDAVEQSGAEWHSFVLLRHGKIVAEGWWNPFSPEYRQTVYSASKTFTSTAIGFAVSEKLLSVDDKVVSFFPDLLPDTVSSNLAQMSIKNLLSMATGQESEPSRQGTGWAKGFLDFPVKYEPGTVFNYNSMATYMLSAIIQKVTGQRLLDYLTPRLFQPLGIEGAEWEISPDSINTGGWGLRVKTEDMAKLGQLYLQKGKWNGRQLLPESWIEEATSAHILQKPEITDEQRATDDWAQGYCYQMWRCRNNAYRADGAYGQYIIVMPELDAVLAVQAEVMDMQKELNIVWDYLLPAIKPESLPEDKATSDALKQRLASLKIAPPKCGNTIQPFGEGSYTFTAADGKTKNIDLSLHFEQDTCIMQWNNYTLKFGRENWVKGETDRPAPNLAPNEAAFSEFNSFNVFGTYCFTDSATLTLNLKYIETPHTERFTLVFGNDGKLAVTLTNSMSNYTNYWLALGKKVQ
ncbi:MAG: beta-lactamase family protein [Dysgonamonadaceae bacterium]|jgi:CubicO group peptidase (beta-lactamase class C family)|nr:beta-lactamase family protein [Dysgonamonadaceae bacterium]